MGPQLQLVDPAGVFWGALFGLILALPLALFMSFWMSAVRKRSAVIFGAFLGALLGFVIILGWAGTLLYDTPLPGVSGGPAFFGSVLFCSALGLFGGLIFDLLMARLSPRDYRRAATAGH